jgi:Gametolysin peptidase M11
VLSLDTQYDNDSKQGFDCVPVTPQGELEIMFSLDLPEDFINEHKLALESGETYITIPGGVCGSSRGQQRGFLQQKVDDAVYMPLGTTISILSSPDDHPYGQFRRLKGPKAAAPTLAPSVQKTPAPTVQRIAEPLVQTESSAVQRRVVDPDDISTRKVLVLRVSTRDAAPKLSQPDLTANFFADDALTLRSQYKACSFGKLIFEPAEDDEVTGIVGGVLEIKLDMNAVNATRRTLTNTATLAAQFALGIVSLEGNYDNVIYCHPPGTEGDWQGFSYMNYFVSAFNDNYCGYVSGNMHEVRQMQR